MIHPDTELRLISPEIGFGVVATRLIPRGTVTWALDDLDQRLPPGRASLLEGEYARILERYSYLDTSGCTVLNWDHSRFVNHSCEPSCVGGPWDEFEVAVRDIQPGEQLTDDYLQLAPFEPFDCLCGAPTCRRRVDPSDAAGRESFLRAEFDHALAAGGGLPQPLGWLLDRHGISLSALTGCR